MTPEHDATYQHCPECGGRDGIVEDTLTGYWGICERHKLKWCWFYHEREWWQTRTAEELALNVAREVQLAVYRTVRSAEVQKWRATS
jgi:hypothetical protein